MRFRGSTPFVAAMDCVLIGRGGMTRQEKRRVPSPARRLRIGRVISRNDAHRPRLAALIPFTASFHTLGDAVVATGSI